MRLAGTEIHTLIINILFLDNKMCFKLLKITSSVFYFTKQNFNYQT